MPLLLLKLSKVDLTVIAVVSSSVDYEEGPLPLLGHSIRTRRSYVSVFPWLRPRNTEADPRSVLVRATNTKSKVANAFPSAAEMSVTSSHSPRLERSRHA
jgi:hypothetical protein